MIEKALNADTTTNSFFLEHPCLATALRNGAAQDRPDQVGFAPEKGLPVGPERGLGRKTEAGGAGTPFPAGGMRFSGRDDMRGRQKSSEMARMDARRSGREPNRAATANTAIEHSRNDRRGADSADCCNPSAVRSAGTTGFSRDKPEGRVL